MNANQIISLANEQRARSQQDRAQDSELQAANKAQAERIEAMNAKVAELEKANAELAADRDNWRQQALAEDARANAATETTTRKRGK